MSPATIENYAAYYIFKHSLKHKYTSPVGAMVARRPPKAKAAGSIPVLGAFSFWVLVFICLESGIRKR